jgi:high-affinity iron transporter
MKSITLLLASILLPNLLFVNSALAAVDFEAVSQEIITKGDGLLEDYQPEKNSTRTGNEFSRLYFDVFESSGMEFRLGMQNPDAKVQIESSFAQVIQSAMQGDVKAVLAHNWQRLRAQLQALSVHDNELIQSTLLRSFLILFREGVEAMLLVTALITYLRRSGAADMQYVIWWGVSIALVASLLTAWAFNRVVYFTGATRELVEGGTMLLAAGVLLYVSFWLLAKREADRWQNFIRGQLDQALSTGNLWALGFAAFLAVYREGGETVLFYQALLADTATSSQETLVGAILAVFVLALVFFCYRYLSVKIPLRLFFSLTAFIMYFLAISFIGKGLLEWQVIGIVTTTPLSNAPHWEWLGVFPTRETILAQSLVFLLLPAFYFLFRTTIKNQTNG